MFNCVFFPDSSLSTTPAISVIVLPDLSSILMFTVLASTVEPVLFSTSASSVVMPLISLN